MQSVFPKCELQQSKVATTTKKVTVVRILKTNKINTEQSEMNLTHMICHTKS